ncbi:hypothetical protein [Actinoplanes sp. NPDC049118]|uniref:hypothetical protein n=1 Tax=Actinoplanes sp. NPDC049118 TaxID=3155769 RepID=UPI0033E7C646
MHSEVLGVLDAHLTELQALRRALVAARPIDAGERWKIAGAAQASAQRCAQELGLLLAGEATEQRYRSHAGVS